MPVPSRVLADLVVVYAPHCDQVFKVRDLRQLAACVDQITAG